MDNKDKQEPEIIEGDYIEEPAGDDSRETVKTSQDVSLDAEDIQKRIDATSTQIQGLMKQYKISMYGLILTIVLYLVCMFWLNNQMYTLLLAVPMLLLAFYNNKLGKKVRTLSLEREKLKKMQHPDDKTGVISDGKSEGDLNGGVQTAGITCLNDLPKEYTVLDDVILNGETVENVIVSPYGIVIVDNGNHKKAVEDILEELELNAPVYELTPQEDVADLAAQIQTHKDLSLSEPDIYKILYKVTGLK